MPAKWVLVGIKATVNKHKIIGRSHHAKGAVSLSVPGLEINWYYSKPEPRIMDGGTHFNYHLGVYSSNYFPPYSVDIPALLMAGKGWACLGEEKKNKDKNKDRRKNREWANQALGKDLDLLASWKCLQGPLLHSTWGECLRIWLGIKHVLKSDKRDLLLKLPHCWNIFIFCAILCTRCAIESLQRWLRDMGKEKLH